MTPWVGRLIAATAVVQLLLETIFTSPQVGFLLGMDPAAVATRPWTVVTYLFVHSGILHLATNMFGLYVFGTAVEERMGSRAFILYYLYCGAGAALFSALVNLITPLGPFVGASGAVFGVMVAFATYWPEAEVRIFPLPMPIRAWTLVIGLAVIDLVFAQLVHDGIAHEAHIGGLLVGWLFFRMQGLSRRRPPAPARQEVERVVMVQQTATRETEPRSAAPARPLPPPRPGNDPVATEVDRVLDKISAKGIDSLTPEERRFLDEVSKRKQREVN
jgi:membrane associated rhomboid family serine protease